MVSDVEGTATVTASAGSANATLKLVFVEATDTSRPFGDFAESEEPDPDLPLWVFNDRIGFMGHDGVDTRDVAAVAAAEDLTQTTPLGDKVFVLNVRRITPRNELRALARTLQQQYPTIVQQAGLVANVNGTDQWLVIPDQLIVKFPDDQGSDDNAAILDEQGLPDYKPNRSGFVDVLSKSV